MKTLYPLTFQRVPLGLVIRNVPISNAPIKGEMSREPGERLAPAFSASGQDVWMPEELAQLNNPALVISAVGARCGKVFKQESNEPWGAVANTAVYSPGENSDLTFLWYQVNDENFWVRGGSAQPYVQFDRSLQQRIFLPPLETQQRIANYLDRETAEIDAAVADLDKYVELLGARKSLLISEAIGSGRVKMVPLKFDAQLVTSGSRGWAKYYSEEGYRFIRIADLQRGGYGFRDDNPQYVNISDEREGTRTLTKVGDLVFSITAYLGSIGVITPEQAGAFVSQHVALVRLRGNLWIPQFVAYSALGRSGQRYLTEHSYGGTKSQLNLDQVQDFPVPLISRAKQREIVDRLDHETAEIDSLITESTNLRELLLKRRSVLITEVVTGRKEV